MICGMHWLIENVFAAGFGQVIVDTPIWSLLNPAFIRSISVVMCNWPVEPISTSASNAP